MRSLLLLTILASAFCTANSQATCYWPNGDVADKETPCNDGNGNTWCCGENYLCASNKLCLWKTPMEDGTLRYGRGSCTDKTFQDDNCPKFCFTENEFGWNTGSAVSRCSGKEEKYYCALASSIDCAKDTRVFTMETPTILAPVVASATVTVTKSDTTSSPPTTSTGADQTQPTSQTSSEDKQSSTTSSSAPGTTDPDQGNSQTGSSKTNPLPIGIGVGVGVAAGILACFGIFMFIRHRRKAAAAAYQTYPVQPYATKEGGYPQPQPHVYYQPQPVYQGHAAPVHEAAGSEAQRYEVS